MNSGEHQKLAAEPAVSSPLMKKISFFFTFTLVKPSPPLVRRTYFVNMFATQWGGGERGKTHQLKTVSEDGYLFGALHRFRHHAVSKPNARRFSPHEAANETRAVIRNKRNMDFKLCFGASLVSRLCRSTLELLLRSDSHPRPLHVCRPNSNTRLFTLSTWFPKAFCAVNRVRNCKLPKKRSLSLM